MNGIGLIVTWVMATVLVAVMQMFDLFEPRITPGERLILYVMCLGVVSILAARGRRE